MGAQNRRKQCAYLTIPEICSMFIFCVGLVLLNIVFILSYFNEWYPSDYQAQSYVNTKWNNAECMDMSDPIKYDNYDDNECSFGYPDSDGIYNETFWSCCDLNTCSMAFNYTSLMIGYNLSDTEGDGAKCWIDMQAMTKASCHPNGEYFVDRDFNISVKPMQKESRLAVCALFCKQRYDEFCEIGLGVDVRFEAFTDKCFAGCTEYRLH